MSGASFRRSLANPSLVRVSAVRGRVLCTQCHGENDDNFLFCQWCAAPKGEEKESTNKSTLLIDEEAISLRIRQFRAAKYSSDSVVRRDATVLTFEQFLTSRESSPSRRIQTAQPSDVIAFLCWLDTCGKRRRTAVHAMHCEAVGTSSLTGCSTPPGSCNLRYAHESLRTNYVSKLSTFYESDLGVTSAWSDTLRTGNPVRSDLVSQYMAFTREEQKKAGVAVKQAPALLNGHLRAIIVPMRTRMHCTTSALERVVLARDIALYSVAFRTTKRGDELSRTLIQRILRLPNESGLLFNFQWGKTMRDGADHLMTVAYDNKSLATCPVRAVEQYVQIGSAVGWDMTKGYLFPTITAGAGRTGPRRGTSPISAAQMTRALKTYARAAGERQDFSMHSFRSGGAISQALAGENLTSIMQRAFWKQPSTAWRYMRLMQVVAPGSESQSMIRGISEEQFRHINEFPLSEQSRSWAAFGNEPLL